MSGYPNITGTTVTNRTLPTSTSQIGVQILQALLRYTYAKSIYTNNFYTGGGPDGLRSSSHRNIQETRYAFASSVVLGAKRADPSRPL